MLTRQSLILLLLFIIFSPLSFVEADTDNNNASIKITPFNQTRYNEWLPMTHQVIIPFNTMRLFFTLEDQLCEGITAS